MSGSENGSSPAAHYEPVNAAGGVVYRQSGAGTMVLMIYRRGVWDLPKGKQDEGEDIRKCAVREVAEETGTTGNPPVITHDLGTTLHRYMDKWGSFQKTTWWFAMTTNAGHFSPQRSEEITKICWVGIPEAIRIAEFDNLKTVLQRFQKLHDSGL
jgi:8-oxo-dGTP pyrophosphatase MutT (NUDIX family)